MEILSNEVAMALGLFVGTAVALSVKRSMNSSSELTRRNLSKPCAHGHEKLVQHTAEFGTKVRVFSFPLLMEFTSPGGRQGDGRGLCCYWLWFGEQYHD